MKTLRTFSIVGFILTLAYRANALTIAEVGTANTAQQILGTVATGAMLKSGVESIFRTKSQVEWMNLYQYSKNSEYLLGEISESRNGIELAVSDKNKIEGQLRAANKEAEKLKNSGPNEPPRNHWQGEVKGILKRALRMVMKRLKGKTKEEYLARIKEIAEKAGLDISGEL